MKNAEVAAQFSTNGDTLVAGIVGVFNKTEGVTGSSIKSLLNSLKDFAKQEGLQKLEIQAISVINKDLEKRLLDNARLEEISRTISEDER